MLQDRVLSKDMDLSQRYSPPSKCSKLSADKSDSRSSMMLMNFVEEVKRKKPKNYRFHYEWETEFLFTMSNGKCTCLICHATVAISKKSNLRRHFTTMHKHFNEQFPENSSARAMRVVELKSAFPTASLMEDCVSMGLSPTKPLSPNATSKYFDFFPEPQVKDNHSVFFFCSFSVLMAE
ncbi:zf-C2H2_12 domain-containing protein [Caerostris darwini]|uniref:Zf-C2H2_12 domain-containing protein n=1 Tax=Caerostris darwini TaxID=1538125 RepID=A0AAV4MAM1_9ARAC|nr:zf-C2H2_12 domain-containing protein [Caerostris darwini]